MLANTRLLISHYLFFQYREEYQARTMFEVVTQNRCPDNPSHFFCINFCNTDGLRPTVLFVTHSLSFPYPYLLPTSEANKSSPYSVTFHFLSPWFRSGSGCCSYIRNNITHDFEDSEFSTAWYRVTDLLTTCAYISRLVLLGKILLLFIFKSGTYFNSFSLPICDFFFLSMFTTIFSYYFPIVTTVTTPTTTLPV